MNENEFVQMQAAGRARGHGDDLSELSLVTNTKDISSRLVIKVLKVKKKLVYLQYFKSFSSLSTLLLFY